MSVAGAAMGAMGSAQSTVVVVDDDETARAWADAHLGTKGFEVLEASSGEQALALIAARRPDLVLLDVEMPGLDGYATCERIRAMPGLEALPVVMITGLEDERSIDRAYASGATDFVTKPINWALLAHRLPYLIRAGMTTTALARSRELLSAAQHLALLGSWVLDEKHATVTWSDELFRRLGYRVNEVRASMDVLRARIPEDQISLFERALGQVRETGEVVELTHDVVWPDGTLRAVRHLLESVGPAERREIRGIALDVTEQLAAQQKIHRLAYVDSLTGLPNRARFHDVLVREMERARRNQRALAVLFLDLDNFKRINDTLGHAVGDRLLEEVSTRLKRAVRCYDTVFGPVLDGSMVARLGGDEFTLLLTDLDSPDDASGVATRILRSLSEPVRIDEHDVCVTPSIGIALFPDHGKESGTLLRHADTAMYHAKSAGKNVFRFFDASMDASIQRRMQIEQELRQAIARGELSLHYQPQLDLASASVSGVEALLRWDNALLGQVPPREFILVAEESGLIESVGAFVLETACADMVQWLADGLDVPRVAVNISPVQFLRPDFARWVGSVLQSSGLEPCRLDLEITEAVVVRDVRRVTAVLQELKQLGVQISVDDFGTGYSSLAQLKSLPIDRLKIDQRFVQQITSSPEDAAITSAVIAMAESMSLDVVAEGVETEAQMSFLSRRHCKTAQGFHVSRPMTGVQMERFLRTHAELCTVSDGAQLKRHTVLVVDDDPMSRELVRGLLSGGAFEVLEAKDAEEAFDLMARNEVDIVIADQVMPGMLGTEFLRRIRQLFPGAARILLSGESNREALLSAINDSAVFRFVDKVNTVQALRGVVEDALWERNRQRITAPERILATDCRSANDALG